MELVAQLKNVTKKIGNKTIIDCLSFDVYEGEVFGFLGPNGAGKTTTIRLMVGLMSITEGDILINGASVRTQFEDAVRHVGAIVENPEMYKFLSGYENLIHYSRMTEGITKDKIAETVELVGLTNRINDKVKRYSLGMRQRLGIAQALLHDPKILILDEPLNGLDPAGIREMRDYMRALAKEKQMAIIVSSHQLSEMEMMCDRIGIIDKGKLINIQMVHDNELENERTYAIEVTQIKTTFNLLNKMSAINSVDKIAEAVIFKTKKEQIPNILKQLINNNVDVFSVKEVTRTLEDRFLEITTNKGGEYDA